MVPYPAFVLEAGAPGDEMLMCLATNEDPTARLPQELQAPALTPITSVGSLEALREHFSTAVGAGNITSQTLAWRVLPARERPSNGDAGAAKR